MTEALVKVLRAEYQALLAIGATTEEAIHQVSISLELHPLLVAAFID